MKSFIRKIFEKEIDEQVHSHFVRFGKGRYGKRAALNLMKNDKVKARGSFEYANDFVNLTLELGEAIYNGVVISNQQLGMGGETNKSGLYYYEIQSASSKLINQIKDKVYFMLLSCEASDFSLKMKKSLPKPGKGGDAKIDGKFCQLEADLKYWPKIKEVFFWDLEGKKAVITHDFLIENLILPEGEKDFEKIRILAKRLGKITRKILVDGREQIKEAELEV